MEVLDRMFARPFEVTQFWASDRYQATGMQSGTTVGHLFKYCPEHVARHRPAQGGDWFFKVCDGEGGPFVGDFLPRILPTRHNLSLLEAACIRASGALGAHVDRGGKENWADDQSLFPGIRGWHGVGDMTLANVAYRRDLWQVFAEDWGLELPAPARFGFDLVTITHRPGLPCAAAMVRAVLPIIEVVHGGLKRIRQSTLGEGERRFDIVEYQGADMRTFVQKYDITDVYGRRDLDWEFFRF